MKIVNTGYGNTGCGNNGDCNSGNFNYGDCNTGTRNYGHSNVGYNNRGNNNTGNYNIGSNNDGCHNIGFYNSGNCNNGNRNCGDFNIGSNNNGDYNIGNHNNGDWNKTNFSDGCFNTEETKIMMFNKPSNWTFRDWINSKARRLLNNIFYDVVFYDTTHWIRLDFMNDKEKEQNPEYKITDGYLKKVDEYKNDKQDWWNSLSEYNKKIIKNIPNFDAEIFKEITGIDVKS